MSTHFTCCLTFDFDAMSGWIGTLKSNNPSMISRGEFGAVAIPRILKLLKAYGVRSSFCIPGHTAYAFPELVKVIHSEGHEIVHHGWVHENPAEFNADQEREILEKGLEALQKITGVVPIGYRSPAWDLSPHTHGLLKEFNFTYDSSCMAEDHYPYYLRLGDSWSLNSRYHFGDCCELVEMPVYWGLDDFPLFETHYSPPSIVREIWQGDFDYALANAPGGVFILTLHPQVIGRGHRMLMLESFIEYMKQKEEVRFTTMGDYATTWKRNHPLKSWKPRYVNSKL